MRRNLHPTILLHTRPSIMDVEEPSRDGRCLHLQLLLCGTGHGWEGGSSLPRVGAAGGALAWRWWWWWTFWSSGTDVWMKAMEFTSGSKKSGMEGVSRFKRMREMVHSGAQTCQRKQARQKNQRVEARVGSAKPQRQSGSRFSHGSLS